MATESTTDTSTDSGQADGQTTDEGTTSVLSPDEGGEGGKKEGDTDAGGDSSKQGQATGDQDSGDGDDGELEIKLPEGTDIDEQMLDGFKSVAKETGLDSEKATKLATFYAEQQKAAAKAQEDAWSQQAKEWLGELKKDSEFGGEAFTQNAKLAARAVREYGGDELGDALKRAGLDNFPPLVKAFAKVGKAMAEDSTGADRAKGGKPDSREDTLNKLYNNS